MLFLLFGRKWVTLGAFDVFICQKGLYVGNNAYICNRNRKDRTMKKKRRQKVIFMVCIVQILLVAGINSLVSRCAEGDRLPSEVAKVLPVVSSAERNATYAAEEETAKEAERAEKEAREAPSSGLSRRVYENLEQPAELSGKRETILMKTQFIVSYDTEKLCPYYVCWSLDAARVNGKVKRTDNFHADPVLTGNSVVETTDYNGSGYDRGHLCPAADNKNSEVAMDESFCMTNICPQNQSLNRGAWNELEQLCRDWARDYGTVYICCGPIFDRDRPRKIGTRKDVRISVPDRFFKVVLTLGRVPKAIGFVFPNERCDGDIRDYAVSVDRVEEITGMDFFFQLDDEEEEKLEKECNPAAWGI